MNNDLKNELALHTIYSITELPINKEYREIGICYECYTVKLRLSGYEYSLFACAYRNFQTKKELRELMNALYSIDNDRITIESLNIRRPQVKHLRKYTD